MPDPTYKRCPSCDTANGLDAVECPNCKHAFRTQFVPPGLNQTQAFPPSLNPPTPVHVPTKKRKVRPAFFVVGSSIILLTCFGLWYTPVHQAHAITGSWIEQDNTHQLGLTLNPDKTGILYAAVFGTSQYTEMNGNTDNTTSASPLIWSVDGKYLTLDCDRDPGRHDASTMMGNGKQLTVEYEFSDSGNVLKTTAGDAVHIFHRKKKPEQ